MILEDLEKCKSLCNKKEYERIGKTQMTHDTRQHMKQRSRETGEKGMTEDTYKGNTQKRMIEDLQKKKENN